MMKSIARGKFMNCDECNGLIGFFLFDDVENMEHLDKVFCVDCSENAIYEYSQIKKRKKGDMLIV